MKVGGKKRQRKREGDKREKEGGKKEARRKQREGEENMKEVRKNVRYQKRVTDERSPELPQRHRTGCRFADFCHRRGMFKTC